MAVKAADLNGAIEGASRSVLFKALSSSERVREWLGSGVLLGSKDAADILGVDRPRVWRMEEKGRIKRVGEIAASPLFLREDVERLAGELEAERAERSARAAA